MRISRRAVVAGMAFAPAVAAVPSLAFSPAPTTRAPHVGWTGDHAIWDPHGQSEPCRLAPGPVPAPPTPEQLDWMV